MLIFKSLALMVVQRQTAASRSTNPCSTGQHVSFALLPIPMCTRPPSKSTHAPSLRVSMGHVFPVGGVGDGTTGGGGGGQGVSVGGGLGTTGTGVGVGVGGGSTGGNGGGLGTTGGSGGIITGGLGTEGGGYTMGGLTVGGLGT